MNITATKFNTLTLNKKGEIVFQYGSYIGTRIYYNQKLNLYSVNDYFVEVWYEADKNKIWKIEVLSDFNKLDLYIAQNS